MMKSINLFLFKSAIVIFTIAGLTACQPSEDKSFYTTKDETLVDSDEKLLKLKVAGYDLDRLGAIVNGKVGIEGCEVEFHKVAIGDANTAAFSGAGTYDVTELGLNPYLLAYANDDFRDYTLIPVFPIRVFRHKSIFIHSERGIETPADLKGRKIGTPGYSSTSLTWIRGMLKDEYGVSPEDIEWVLSNVDGGAETAGKISKNEQVVPEGINAVYGTAGMDESELLLSGEVDAIFHAAEPKVYVEGNPMVQRLFPDSRSVEQGYFKKTGIFPIMHVVGIKTELLEKHPWLAEAVFEAYSQAKAIHYQKLNKLGWAYSSLPWFAQEYEQTKNLMGANFWPYGIEDNRKTLETILRYSYEQGLASQELTIEELFDASTLKLTEK